MEQNLKKLQQEVKEQYKMPEMSSEQVERLKMKMKQAKRENQKDRVRRVAMRGLATAASVMLVLFALANTSKTVAMAMQQIPLLGGFVKLITIRDYQYEDHRHAADISVGELVLEDISGTEDMDASVRAELEKTLAKINTEMRAISEDLLDTFEQSVEGDEGPFSTYVKGELLPTTERYVVIKLCCFTVAGSGIEWNYYYTVDLSTGKQISLADLFVEGVDYITPISDNIIDQMHKQMEEDPTKSFNIATDKDEYSIDVAEVLRERQAFYVNERGNIVIGFDEGEVAAMYMGALEFEIDNEVIKDIRK